MNRQIYAFVVVEDEELVKALSKMNAEVMNSSSDPFYGAKSMIIVFADSNAPTYLYDGRSIAIGNLMNAANALVSIHIGSIVLREFLKRILVKN